MKWLAVHLYRFLLVLFPKDVRRTLGPSMLRTFEDRMERDGSPLLLTKELFDVVATGLRERRGRPAKPRARRKGTEMDLFLKDLRQAIRSLSRSPGFSAVAVLSLSLGIGSASAIFSLVNALILKPMPVERPDELVAVYPTRADDPSPLLVSYPNLRDLAESARLSSLVGFQGASLSLQLSGGDPELVWGEVVTENFFEGLGVRASLGRTFLPEDAHRPRAVLNHDFWRRRFGADESILGRGLRINDRAFEVVGVAASGFSGAKFLGFTPDLWIPLTMHEAVWGPTVTGEDRLERRRDSFLNVRGRLKPGVSVSEAEASLSTIAARLEAEYPDANKGWRLHVIPAPGKVEPFVEAEIGNAIPLAAAILQGLSVLLLLVACANVASLAFSRARERRGELQVRLSLGATRLRLARHIALESVVLAVVSGLGGLWLSDMLVRGSLRLTPPFDFAIDYGVETDWRVVCFAAAMTLVSALFSALPPSLRLSRSGLHDGNQGRSSQRLSGRRFLVIPQIAFSMVALVSAGLLVRSFQNAIGIRPGFHSEGLVLASVNPALKGYDDEGTKALLQAFIERVRALPEVDAASLAFPLPLDAYSSATRVLPEGSENASHEEERTLVFNSTVDEAYFETMGTKLVHGRAFGREDDKRSRPVAIVNETLARRFWPGEMAIGKRFSTATDSSWEVVGVAEDGKYLTLGEEPRPYFYLPLRQNHDSPVTVIVRSDAPRTVLEPKLRAEIRALDPTLPLYGVKTGEEFLSRSLSGPRGLAVTVSIFAALTLLLAALGVYGLMSFSVSQRRQELGIRMALGASREDVLGLFLVQGVRVVAIGIVGGLALSFASSRFLSNLLFGVDAASPSIYAGVTLLMTAVALAGTYFPSRRAAELDPLKSLRHE